MIQNESDLIEIREMLIDIHLALSSSHNTVTTDDVDAQPDEMHWRIDHTKPVKQIDEIAERLGINLCSSPRCSDINKQKQQSRLRVIENLKRELESPDLQQVDRDTLKHVIDCLSGTQTKASL